MGNLVGCVEQLFYLCTAIFVFFAARQNNYKILPNQELIAIGKFILLCFFLAV